MRSLFWRIFAAIWLANIAIIIALSWITTVSFETEKIPGLEITRLQAAMDEQLRRLDRHARRDGAARLEHSLRIAASRGGVGFFAIDANNVDHIARPLSPEVIAAAAATRAGAVINSERMRTLASSLHGDNRPLVLVAAVEGSLLERVLFKRPFGGWTHIVIALIVSALVSALLAWYVAAPLARIRDSTRRFAEGDLDARVGHLRFGRSTEVTALANEFDHMAERIKALIENNRRLVRDVSHELRSPLARLRVALELARGQDAAAVEKSLDRIERESDRLEGMLAQAIELSRLETRLERVHETFALDELLEDVSENADYEGTPHGHKVVLARVRTSNFDGTHDPVPRHRKHRAQCLCYTAEAARRTELGAYGAGRGPSAHPRSRARRRRDGTHAHLRTVLSDRLRACAQQRWHRPRPRDRPPRYCQPRRRSHRTQCRRRGPRSGDPLAAVHATSPGPSFGGLNCMWTGVQMYSFTIRKLND